MIQSLPSLSLEQRRILAVMEEQANEIVQLKARIMMVNEEARKAEAAWRKKYDALETLHAETLNRVKAILPDVQGRSGECDDAAHELAAYLASLEPEKEGA